METNSKTLNTIDGKTLMETELKPLDFVVDTLLAQGLHILAGSPKVGKSWLALWFAVTVAKGESMWGCRRSRARRSTSVWRTPRAASRTGSTRSRTTRRETSTSVPKAVSSERGWSSSSKRSSHFIVNAVCFETGKMLRQRPNTLQRLRAISDELCMAHGLSVLPKRQKRSDKVSAREYRSAAKGQSWKFQLMATVDECMRYARTREEFISLMRGEGYGVRWTDARKNITYTTPKGKKCRDDRLHDVKYLKEVMEHEFRTRAILIAGGVEAEQSADGADSSLPDLGPEEWFFLLMPLAALALILSALFGDWSTLSQLLQ